MRWRAPLHRIGKEPRARAIELALQRRALGFKIIDSDPGKAHVIIPHHPKRVLEAPAVQLLQPQCVLSVDIAADEVWSGFGLTRGTAAT